MREYQEVAVTKRIAAAVTGVFVGSALLFSFGAGEAQAIQYDRSCGTLPGDGAFNYVRAKNTTCTRAWKTTRQSWKKFCSTRNRCFINPYGDITKVYRGSVRRNGWRCKVSDGWELIRVKCRKGQRFVIWRTGS